jgi:LAO/AO transport system kinase
LKSRRRDQAKAWLWHELSDSLMDALKADPQVAAKLSAFEAKVGAGKMAPGTAARALLSEFLGN